MIEIGVNVKTQLEGRLEVKAVKNGVYLGTMRTKNTITDAGLAMLKTARLTTILDTLMFARKVNAGYSISQNPDLEEYVKVAELIGCGTGFNGLSEKWQDSWLEGWTSNDNGDTDAVAGDFSWREFSREWLVTTANAFDLDDVRGTLPARPDGSGGVGEGDNGGRTSGLTTFIIGEPYALSTVALATGCVAEPGTPTTDNEKLFPVFLDGFWCHGLSWNELGDPAVLDIADGVNFIFTYTVRAVLPVVGVTEVINVNGTDYTFETRAHAVNSADNWSPKNMGLLASPSTAVAWDSNTMPALDVLKSGGSSVSAASASLLASSGNYHDVKYTWNAAQANFAGGIGAITHGLRVTGIVPFAITTITPKIVKAATQNFRFTARYSWDRT